MVENGANQVFGNSQTINARCVGQWTGYSFGPAFIARKRQLDQFKMVQAFEFVLVGGINKTNDGVRLGKIFDPVWIIAINKTKIRISLLKSGSSCRVCFFKNENCFVQCDHLLMMISLSIRLRN